MDEVLSATLFRLKFQLLDLQLGGGTGFSPLEEDRGVYVIFSLATGELVATCACDEQGRMWAREERVELHTFNAGFRLRRSAPVLPEVIYLGDATPPAGRPVQLAIPA